MAIVLFDKTHLFCGEESLHGRFSAINLDFSADCVGGYFAPTTDADFLLGYPLSGFRVSMRLNPVGFSASALSPAVKNDRSPPSWKVSTTTSPCSTPKDALVMGVALRISTTLELVLLLMVLEGLLGIGCWMD